jgi:hypothetical protein
LTIREADQLVSGDELIRLEAAAPMLAGTRDACSIAPASDHWIPELQTRSTRVSRSGLTRTLLALHLGKGDVACTRAYLIVACRDSQGELTLFIGRDLSDDAASAIAQLHRRVGQPR